MGCLASMNFDCIMTGWVGEEKYEVVVGAMVTVSCPVHWWWYAWFWTSNLKCKWQITWTLTAAENTSVLNFQKLNCVHAWLSILCSYTRASVASSVGKNTSEEPKFKSLFSLSHVTLYGSQCVSCDFLSHVTLYGSQCMSHVTSYISTVVYLGHRIYVNGTGSVVNVTGCRSVCVPLWDHP